MSMVRDAFQVSKMRREHGVWMLNRILEALDFVHVQKKVVHGAILPDTVMVYSSGLSKDEFNHGARLIDWSYAAKIGTPLKAISPAWESFYPPEAPNTN